MTTTHAGGEILFGQIALQLGYLKPEDLEEAIRVQEKSDRPVSLGYLLLELKLLSPEQIDRVLGIQRENIQSLEQGAGAKFTASLFGRIVVSHGFATQGQVNEVLRDQELFHRKGYPFKLGELLVRKGYLQDHQVDDILALQHKSILVCPRCYLTYNVPTDGGEGEVRCARCHVRLEPRRSAPA